MSYRKQHPVTGKLITRKHRKQERKPEEGGGLAVGAAAVREERLPPVSWVGGEPIHRQCGRPLVLESVSGGELCFKCWSCYERIYIAGGPLRSAASRSCGLRRHSHAVLLRR